MKLYGLPVLLFSLAEWLLAAAPLYWLLPKMYGLLLSGILDYTLLLRLVPYVLAWLLYFYLIRILLLYMQFGFTGGTGMFSSLLVGLRVILPSTCISAFVRRLRPASAAALRSDRTFLSRPARTAVPAIFTASLNAVQNVEHSGAVSPLVQQNISIIITPVPWHNRRVTAPDKGRDSSFGYNVI